MSIDERAQLLWWENQFMRSLDKLLAGSSQTPPLLALSPSEFRKCTVHFSKQKPLLPCRAWPPGSESSGPKSQPALVNPALVNRVDQTRLSWPRPSLSRLQAVPCRYCSRLLARFPVAQILFRSRTRARCPPCHFAPAAIDRAKEPLGFAAPNRRTGERKAARLRTMSLLMPGLQMETNGVVVLRADLGAL